MPFHELQFSLVIERLSVDPAVEPRHLVGSLQQRLRTVRNPPPEDLIPDNAQQGGEEQTGSDAKGGGRRNSHSGPINFGSHIARRPFIDQPALCYFADKNGLSATG